MNNELFVQQITPMLTAMLVVTFVGTVLALVLGVMTLSGRRVSPLLAGVPTGSILLLTLGLSLWSGAAGQGQEAAQSAVYGVLGVTMFALFFVLPAAFFGGLLTAAGGCLRGPREPIWPALALLPGLAAVVSPTVFGLMVGQGLELLAYLRTGIYAALLVLTLLALFSGNRAEGGGPAAAAMAGLSFASVVAIGEASGRAMFYFFLLGEFVGMDDPAQRMELLDAVRLELLSTSDVGSWVAVGCAALVGLIGVISATRGRRWSSALGLLWLPLWVLPMLFIDVPNVLWRSLAEALA